MCVVPLMPAYYREAFVKCLYDASGWLALCGSCHTTVVSKTVVTAGLVHRYHIACICSSRGDSTTIYELYFMIFSLFGCGCRIYGLYNTTYRPNTIAINDRHSPSRNLISDHLHRCIMRHSPAR